MNITTNLTNNFTMDTLNHFQNLGCQGELNNLSKMCMDFKVSIISKFNTKFMVGFYILIILIFFIMFVKYIEPKWSKTETYSFIAKRIDWIILLISICEVAILFL